jgi:hypothetical protein
MFAIIYLLGIFIADLLKSRRRLEVESVISSTLFWDDRCGCEGVTGPWWHELVRRGTVLRALIEREPLGDQVQDVALVAFLDPQENRTL